MPSRCKNHLQAARWSLDRSHRNLKAAIPIGEQRSVYKLGFEDILNGGPLDEGPGAQLSSVFVAGVALIDCHHLCSNAEEILPWTLAAISRKRMASDFPTIFATSCSRSVTSWLCKLEIAVYIVMKLECCAMGL